MKRYTALPGILLLTLASGCFYELRDEVTECKIGWNIKWAAHAAYRDYGAACMGVNCPHSFKDGFMAGFKAVANGGTGCPPAVPVLEFCNHMWLDIGCSDSDKMESWYDGYEHGGMAARGTGMGDSNRITTRVPHSTPVDYAAPGTSHLQHTTNPVGSPDAIPPSPVDDVDNEVEVIGGPQTRR